MTQEPNNPYKPDPYAEDELVPFDVQDYANKRGMRMLIIVSVLVLALLLFFFKVYAPGTRDRGDAPTVTAEKTPFKIEPDDPGGKEEPHQDLEIYEAGNGQSSTSDVNVTESSEEPISRPGTVNIDVRDRNSTADNEKPVAEDKPAKPVQVETTPPVTASTNSRYVVQLASLRSQSAATDTKNKISSAHGSIFPSGSFLEIKRADLADKGIYYRVRLAGLSGKDSAQRICSQLQSRNQNCFTTTR